MDTKISVVTVCYNSELEIEKTIRSVLEQNYGNLEYIVKDGSSTDRTNEIISNYKCLFENKGIPMQHIISEDKGIYDAMNMAVKDCNGDWVIFMNSGDLFYDKFVLSDVFSRREWDGIDVVYGHTLLRLSEDKGCITNHNADYLEERMSLCHQSLFVRKELLQKFPFDCKYRIKADYDQMLRLKRSGYIFAKANVIISDRNMEGISNKLSGCCNKEDNMLIAKYGLHWKKKMPVIGYIKQIIKRVAPGLTLFWSMQKRDKNIIKYK